MGSVEVGEGVGWDGLGCERAQITSERRSRRGCKGRREGGKEDDKGKVEEWMNVEEEEEEEEEVEEVEEEVEEEGTEKEEIEGRCVCVKGGEGRRLLGPYVHLPQTTPPSPPACDLIVCTNTHIKRGDQSQASFHLEQCRRFMKK